jgi:hypothetical protein
VREHFAHLVNAREKPAMCRIGQAVRDELPSLAGTISDSRIEG